MESILKEIPISKVVNDNLLIGYENSDDASVYKISDEKAIIQTLDFFTPMLDDPYLFGQITASNALSDVYAMGGEVITALNIVCFPKSENIKILGEILKGGANKVIESGGVLTGGHSIIDKDIKYGLSVTGIVHPKKIIKNNGCKIGDKIILTKKLGTGIIMARYNGYREKNESYKKAIEQMIMLNKKTSEIMSKYKVNGCTDVTGFGFLGHLNEMVTEKYTIEIESKNIKYIEEAYEYAKEFIITSGGQKNRKYLEDKIKYDIEDESLKEVLLDPQTSGGLIISVEENSEQLIEELEKAGITASVVGNVIRREEKNIIVR